MSPDQAKRRRWMAVLVVAVAGGLLVGLRRPAPSTAVERAGADGRARTAGAGPAQAESLAQVSAARPFALLSRPRWLPAQAPAPVPAPAPAREPFSDLSGTAEQQRLLRRAEEAAIAACMAERGLLYTPGEDAEDDADEAEEATPPLLGDVEAARAGGYGLADALTAGDVPLAPDANQRRLDALPPAQRQAWQEAFAGKPFSREELLRPNVDPAVGSVTGPSGAVVRWRRDSCLARARRALYQDEGRSRRLALLRDELRNAVRDRVSADAAYAAGIERWRACMAAQGLPYEEPGQASEALGREHAQGRITLPALRAREVEVATADAACYQRSGLPAAHAAAQIRAEQDVQAHNAGLLDAIRADHLQAVDRAHRWRMD